MTAKARDLGLADTIDFIAGGAQEREGFWLCGPIGTDGDTIHLYYGASDSCMAMATGSICAILAWLESNSTP